VNERVPFAASGIGSYWYEGAHVLATALTRHGYDLDLNTKTSNVNNVLSVAKGESVLGITTPQFVEWAERRLGAFAGQDLPELRVVAVLNLPLLLAAAVDRASGFTTLAELARARYPWKVVSPGPENLVGTYVDRIMEAHGLSRESVVSWGGADLRPHAGRTPQQRAQQTGPNVMVSQTAAYAKSGAANGFFLYINGSSEWARDMTVLQDLRFLRFDEAILESIAAEWGGTMMTLPARLFPGADDDLPVIGWRHHYIYGTAAVPDDLARAVLTALEDERILDNAAGISFSGLAPVLPKSVKLHDVTENYYKQRS
jgi:hypothetical protein